VLASIPHVKIRPLASTGKAAIP